MARNYGTKMAVTFYVTADQLKAIDQLANADERTRANWLNKVIIDKLNNKGN